jgi:hypothetical protein
MSATNTFETDILGLIFNATAIANLADNAASSPAAAFYISLHTASPGETGDQSTSETTYTGYARVAVNRNSGGWTVSGSSATNTAEIDFGQCTGGAQTITHVGLGTASSGTGKLLLSNALDSSLVLAAGATPLFSIGELEFTCD